MAIQYRFYPSAGCVSAVVVVALLATTVLGQPLASLTDDTGPSPIDAKAIASPSQHLTDGTTGVELNAVPAAQPMSTNLRIVDGAYPVYYGVARSNGRFGKRIRAYGVHEYDQMKRDDKRKAVTKDADIRK